MPQKRSALQKAHSLTSMASINTRKMAPKEHHTNIPVPQAVTSSLANTVSILQKKLENSTRKLTEIVKKLRNRTKEAKRAKETRDSLRNELSKQKHVARMKASRLPYQKALGARRILRNANSECRAMKLKHKGVVTDSGREMIMELSSARVPDSSINSVIQTVGRWLGIHVRDAISERTVGRIIKEGGVAAKLQMVNEIEREKGFTVSGDGTTIRHLNFEAKHITVNAPSYESDNASDSQTTPQVRFFGVTSGPNHTSETQLESWKEISSDAYDTYNRAFKADGKYADPLSFARYMLGNGSDHSEDQRKLDRLLVGWKEVCEPLLQGKEALSQMSLQDLMRCLWEENVKKLADAGGLEAWESLSDDEKDQRDQETYDRLCRRLGDEAWEKLSTEAKEEAALYIWTGCCMHKEMNGTKGGATHMGGFWSRNKIPGPWVSMCSTGHMSQP